MKDGNKLNYEKHQRDYTVLACSEMAEEFYNERMTGFFSYESNPIYMLIENGIFYHFVTENDYLGLAAAYSDKYPPEHLQKYANSLIERLKDYREFLNLEHKDLEESIVKLHEAMRIFLPIVIATAYLPLCGKAIDENTLKLCIRIRREYEDVHRLGMSLQKKLLNRLELERGIERNILQYLTSREFNNFLKNGDIPKNIKNRKDFVFIKNFKKEENIFTRDEALKILDEIDDSRKQINVDTFNGNIAHRGISIGKVKIMRLIEDAESLEDGNVLVASMTDPRYISAMKRASAIVTDEGGITCHAAIVSREMKKPCIIGTKIATQVLKDGDWVEVDANEGAVKVIKRANES